MRCNNNNRSDCSRNNLRDRQNILEKYKQNRQEPVLLSAKYITTLSACNCDEQNILNYDQRKCPYENCKYNKQFATAEAQESEKQKKNLVTQKIKLPLVEVTDNLYKIDCLSHHLWNNTKRIAQDIKLSNDDVSTQTIVEDGITKPTDEEIEEGLKYLLSSGDLFNHENDSDIFKDAHFSDFDTDNEKSNYDNAEKNKSCHESEIIKNDETQTKQKYEPLNDEFEKYKNISHHSTVAKNLPYKWKTELQRKNLSRSNSRVLSDEQVEELEKKLLERRKQRENSKKDKFAYKKLFSQSKLFENKQRYENAFKNIIDSPDSSCQVINPPKKIDKTLISKLSGEFDAKKTDTHRFSSNLTNTNESSDILNHASVSSISYENLLQLSSKEPFSTMNILENQGSFEQCNKTINHLLNRLNSKSEEAKKNTQSDKTSLPIGFVKPDVDKIFKNENVNKTANLSTAKKNILNMVCSPKIMSTTNAKIINKGHKPSSMAEKLDNFKQSSEPIDQKKNSVSTEANINEIDEGK